MTDIMDAKTGDTVFHKPTGEEWLVAYADSANNRIAWCGWPPGRALLSDCVMVESCTSEKSEKLIGELAAMTSDDPRGQWARRYLEAKASAQ